MENILVDILNSQPFIIVILAIANVIQYRDKKEYEKRTNENAAKTIELFTKLELMFSNVINNDMNSQQQLKEVIAEIKSYNEKLKDFLIEKFSSLK